MADELDKLGIKLKAHVKEKDKISIKSSKINREFEKFLLLLITEILHKVNQERYIDVLYTITKELAINGVKANQKRIFFEEEGLSILNEDDYSTGMDRYKSKFSDRMVDEYGVKSQQKGIYVQINFFYHKKGMYVEVMNNTPVIKKEEARLREKMKKAMGYNDIAEFYIDNMDNTEGAGLGIALTVILLKNENIDPNLFRIITKPDMTIARVEIPFVPDYTSLRKSEIR
ncbi:MAG: histidine kinase [Leptospiraceae bacterium]|nr:histidine kinase [Leptospiraceae bacterium]MCP5496226.1 histidine kinase [Leptospiraceae bacterium]